MLHIEGKYKNKPWERCQKGRNNVRNDTQQEWEKESNRGNMEQQEGRMYKFESYELCASVCLCLCKKLHQEGGHRLWETIEKISQTKAGRKQQRNQSK